MDEIPVLDALQQARERIQTFDNNWAQHQLDLSGLGLTEENLQTLMPSIHLLGNLNQLDLSDIPLNNTAIEQLGLSDLFGTQKVNISYGENDTYNGDLRFGKLHGEGIRNFANGDVYEGQFTRDKFNGQGNLKRANGNSYEGAFKMGAYHGQGVFKNAGGDSHEGTFVEGKINGWGTSRYSSGEVLKGVFDNGKIVFDDSEHQMKPNTVLTMVVRSNRMVKENRSAQYEAHKHKKGGLPVKVAVVANGRELLDAIKALLETQKDTKSFRLAFNQHSGNRVNPDIKIKEEEAKAILQLLIDKGIEDIKISSHSCNLCEAQLFIDLAPNYIQNAQITVLTVPDGKNAFEGWKKNKNGEKKFTSFYVNDEGDYALRDKYIFKKEQKQQSETFSDTKEAQKEAFTVPLNQERLSLTSGKERTAPRLQPRKVITPNLNPPKKQGL
ncbi:hypothetical protein [Ascidiimonas sp. W6]|uniref:MORN repeat-containing protein n=1 Tax=Ascidiimonas meishanensis TaxID=3128903 RepID=UPI0030EBCC7B